MHLKALKVFCDVARCRSFSQAAAENRKTQAAASLIVRQLEKRLGVQLIDRRTRPLRLTELGRAYYEGCQALLEQYEELEASIRRARPERAAVVRVAAIYSIGLGDMGQCVARFEAGQPHSRVQVEYLHPDRVYEKVLDGTVDFGLVSFPRPTRELAVEPWRDEEMVLACRPDHPLARRKAAPPALLADEKYVGFEKGLVIRREVDRFLREQGVAVGVAAEFDNIENIKKGVEVGAGVALLPEPTLRQEVRAGVLAARPLEGCRFVRPLGVISRRRRKLGGAARRFLEFLRQSGDHPPAAGAQRNGSDGGNAAPRTRKGSR